MLSAVLGIKLSLKSSIFYIKKYMYVYCDKGQWLSKL